MGERPTSWTQSRVITLPKKRQPAAVPELPNNQPHQSPKQSDAENLIEQLVGWLVGALSPVNHKDYIREEGDFRKEIYS